jgi:protein phosphatase
MTIGIRFTARSDVGMLREGNEDSAYAGTRLLAVADGMGGHVGGEIASAAAIQAIKRLDTDIPTEDLGSSLEQAVRNANQNLHNLVEQDPSLQGMGTTLTAMLWNGAKMALVHIGDSRAYLLRNGELFQITHDHTLVQSLVDEGRISIDEAATHPQRSLLLRALDGRSDVDPDVQLREAQLGDRYLLCSDGLSGVVTPETIHHTLSTTPDGEQAVRQLIDLANRGGGPDNITCVLADVVEVDPGPTAPSMLVGAAQASQGSQAATTQTIPRQGPDTPAQRAATMRDSGGTAQPTVVDLQVPEGLRGANGTQAPPPQPPAPQAAEPRRRRRIWLWVTSTVVVVLVLLAVGAYFGVQAINSQYYVAADGGEVAIFQGSTSSLLGFKISKIYQRYPLQVSDLEVSAQHSVGQTISGLTLSQARKTVQNLQSEVCQLSLAPDAGYVAVWRGFGNSGCQQSVVFKPSGAAQVKITDLPKADQTRLTTSTGIAIPSVTSGQGELLQLAAAAAQCKTAHPASGCPTSSGGAGGKKAP